jgi:hypothetical protein
VSGSAAGASSRAWYSHAITGFLNTDPDSILGRLTSNSDFAVLPGQRDAWLGEIHVLQEQLRGLSGSLFMEFGIPRMGRRIDAVLLIGAAVFVIEFTPSRRSPDMTPGLQIWASRRDGSRRSSMKHVCVAVR